MKLILDWDRGKWFQLFKNSKHNPLELHIPEIENLWFPPTGTIVHEQIDKKGRSLLKTLQQFIADKLRYSDLQIELVDGFKIFRRYCSRTVPEAVKQLSGCYDSSDLIWKFEIIMLMMVKTPKSFEKFQQSPNKVLECVYDLITPA